MDPRREQEKERWGVNTGWEDKKHRQERETERERLAGEVESTYTKNPTNWGRNTETSSILFGASVLFAIGMPVEFL